MQPQDNQQINPQTEPQLVQSEDLQSVPNHPQGDLSQTDSSTTSSLHNLPKVLSITGIVAAGLSLVLSIISLVVSLQNNQPSDQTNDIVAGSFESQPVKISCNLPKSAKDIVYLYLSTNSGATGIFVSPEGNIESFTKDSSNTGDVLTTTKNVETDTSDIFEQLLNNGINDFSSYEYPGYSQNENPEEQANWGWLAQIDNSDSSSCEAKGNDTPPAWFNDLKGLIDSKFAQ